MNYQTKILRVYDSSSAPKVFALVNLALLPEPLFGKYNWFKRICAALCLMYQVDATDRVPKANPCSRTVPQDSNAGFGKFSV